MAEGFCGVFVCARSERVTHRCHNWNPRSETELGSANDVTHRKRAGDFGRFEKVSWSCRPKKKGDFRLLAEALGRCRTRWG